MADFDMNKLKEQLENFDVNDIDWDRVGVWPLPVRALLCVLACAALLIGCHFLFIKDKQASLESARSQESSLRSSFEAKAYEAANLDKYRLQLAEMDRTIGALVSRLPTKNEVPGLLEDIDEKGIESRLEIEQIDLQAEKATDIHIELPINIKVIGGFHEFGAFVSGVAGMPRIVTLDDFSISPVGKDGRLRMEIAAKTYRYKAADE